MSITPGYIAFKLATEISPIILTRGIAANFGLGQLLPIVALTEGVNFLQNLILSGSPTGAVDLDKFFAHFYVLPGTQLQSQQVAMVPMANQAVAANATIQQPLPISMMMICPAREDGGYAAKFATMTALQRTLSQHNGAGGTYTVVTPSYIFTDCLMLSMRDVTGGEAGRQRQQMWQLDFVQPLVSISAIDSAVNSQMSKLQKFLPLDGGSSAIPASGLSLGSAVSSIFGGTVAAVAGSVQTGFTTLVPP
jgi:hypothetical protein